MKKTRLAADLFFTLFKIGLFTFGGGYAMLALFENEFVSKKGWMEKEEFLDMVAIAESTPGPIAINSATYVGYKKMGPLGSAIATLGVVLPSFTIIFFISLFLDAFMALPLVASAFRGIQVCVVYLILNAGLKLYRGLKKTPLAIATLIAVAALMLTFSLFAIKFSTIFYILISGCVGLLVYFIKNAKKPATEAEDKKEDEAK